MQLTTKLLMGMVLVTVVTVTSGFSPSRKTEGTAPKAGEKWHGGKPSAPMKIEANPVTPPNPGATAEVTFTLEPAADCQNLRVRVRGLHGVTVPDESIREYAECLALKPISVTTSASVPAGAAGSVAIDVWFTMEDSDYSASRSVAVVASDAAKIKRKSADNLKSTPDGEKLIVMPADSLKR